MSGAAFERWLRPTPKGLYCLPGDFHIDPSAAVDRAVVTHGHSDHARAGHRHVLATHETAAIMRVRHGAAADITTFQVESYGATVDIAGVGVSLLPAGHILGSAQVLLEWRGQRVVVSGDYKRRSDPTCRPFELVPCHLFITEATFGLPVFHHEPDDGEIAKLLSSQATFPERTHLVGAYGLGKCQRLIALLRRHGYDRTIYLHGAMTALCDLYESLGIALGPLETVATGQGVGRAPKLGGEIVLCPPSALQDRWSRRLADPLTVFASGWMRVRGRARQRGVELPLVISDHVDWPELIRTVEETGAEEIWVTHGREEALVHQVGLMGKRGRALALVGREDEPE